MIDNRGMEKMTHSGWTLGGYLPFTLKREDASELVFSNAFSNEDERWMFAALLEGMKGCGISNPNPSVGCVLVKDGKQIASGCTQSYKMQHAEKMACDQLPPGTDLKGCTAYVTLEPCSHFGNQPPCVDLLIQKNISRVVIATEDPNPKVQGQGILKLKEQKIEVTVGILQNEAKLWHFPFLTSQSTKRPVWVGKWAQTSQGLLADDAGNSQWITGPLSRAYGHWLRQKYDAVVVGARTVLWDKPKLSARDCRSPVFRQPMRMILDLRGRISEITPELLATSFSSEQTTILFTDKNQKPPKNLPKHVHLIALEGSHLVESLKKWVVTEEASQIFGKPIQSLYVEGGSQILNLFLEKNGLDALHVFTGSKELSGKKNQIFWPKASAYRKVSEVAIQTDVLKEFVRA